MYKVVYQVSALTIIFTFNKITRQKLILVLFMFTATQKAWPSWLSALNDHTRVFAIVLRVVWHDESQIEIEQNSN